MRISDWSSDVCSSDLAPALGAGATHLLLDNMSLDALRESVAIVGGKVPTEASGGVTLDAIGAIGATGVTYVSVGRSEEHTSELQSLMRISYAVFCLKKKNNT